MKFVSSRDVRNNPARLREALEREDVVLTAGGKPFAIAIGVGEGDVEETLEVLRRVRALRAMTRMQTQAEERDLSEMSMDEIDAEIRDTRKARRRSA
ncbi:MAG: type II toxin-antitoxin system Phd/YefM family antitoxin [Gemmatimonadota bacterium]